MSLFPKGVPPLVFLDRDTPISSHLIENYTPISIRDDPNILFYDFLSIIKFYCPIKLNHMKQIQSILQSKQGKFIYRRSSDGKLREIDVNLSSYRLLYITLSMGTKMRYNYHHFQLFNNRFDEKCNLYFCGDVPSIENNGRIASVTFCLPISVFLATNLFYIKDLSNENREVIDTTDDLETLVTTKQKDFHLYQMIQVSFQRTSAFKETHSSIFNPFARVSTPPTSLVIETT